MTKMGRPKSENPKKKTLSIRVEDSLYQRICAYAEQHQMTVTEVVLQGLERLLSEPKYWSPSSYGKEEPIWQRHEKTCEGELCGKEKCREVLTSGMRIPIQIRLDGANISTQMIL